MFEHTSLNSYRPGPSRATTAVSLILCATFAMVLGSSLALAQTQAPSGEIEISAPKSLSRLRSEISKAEDAMFDLFNELNDDDRFDINCRYEKRWQSKIRERVCSPNYLVTAQEEEVNLFMGTLPEIAGTQRGGPGVTAMDHNNALLREKMQAIYQQNPGFRQALDRLEGLKQIYEERRQARR